MELLKNFFGHELYRVYLKMACDLMEDITKFEENLSQIKSNLSKCLQVKEQFSIKDEEQVELKIKQLRRMQSDLVKG